MTGCEPISLSPLECGSLVHHTARRHIGDLVTEGLAFQAGQIGDHYPAAFPADEAGFEDWGLEFGNPDFVAYAESYGAKGFRVERTDDLLEMLTSCLEAGGVNVIEVPIDYAENANLTRR